MSKLYASILVLSMLFGMTTTFAYSQEDVSEQSILTITTEEGLPDGAIVLKDIFTDSFTGCTWGGWSITGEIADDNVKVGGKSFKILAKEDGSFGQGAITFPKTISGDNKKINAAIAEGCAYIGLWEYIPSGTSWYEIKANNGEVLRTSTRDQWQYMYKPLNTAANNGTFIYLKNQSKKDYWIDQMQIFMIPPEDTSMNISSFVFYNKANEVTNKDNVFVESPIEIKFDHYVMPDTGTISIFDENGKEVEASILYDDRTIKLQPATKLNYSSEYKIQVSGVNNMFDETVSDTEFAFYTAKPEFRVENITYLSNGNELELEAELDELQTEALIINDLDENKNYRFVSFNDDENGGKVFAASDFRVCSACGNDTVSIVSNNFGTVKYSDKNQLGYYFLDENNIVVDECEAASTVFSDNTDVSVKGKKLDVNIETEAKEQRSFTIAMIPRNDSGYDWTKPGLIYCDTLDDNGCFSKDFDLSDYIASGYYDVLIYGDGIKNQEGIISPYIEKDFYYVSKQKRDEIINIIQKGSKEEIESLLNNEDNTIALNSLGIMIDKYAALAERKAYACELVAKMPIKDKEGDVLSVSALNRCILLQMINEASDKTGILLDNLSSLDISERVTATLSDLKDNGNILKFSSFFDYNTYTDFVDFDKKIEEFALLAGLNSVKEGDYPLVLQYCNNYKDVLEYDIDNKMKENNISDYNQILVLKSLIGKEFKTKSDIVSTISSSIATYKPKINYGGSSGGVSGGTSVKGGISIPSNVVSNKEASKELFDGKTFSDVDEAHWANSYIMELVSKGIIDGYEDKTFRPNNNITRAEFVKILVSALFTEYDGANSEFDDVTNSHWAYKYISYASEKGIIFGVDDNSFAPDRNITNEEMAVICSRTISALNISIDDKNKQAFNDFNDISDFAKMSVINLMSLDIIDGDENYCFRPKNTLTRAQTAKIIYQMLELEV